MFDVKTLALAKAHTDSQLLANSESHNAVVLDMDAYGLPMLELFAAGGGRRVFDAGPMLDKIERGRRCILRAQYQSTIMEIEPSHIQYNADGTVFGLGFTVRGDSSSGGMMAAVYMVKRGSVLCTVSSAAIPS